MPTWDDLRYVLEVHRHGSLGGAARALGLNKSTISRRVAALEHELGATLMQRGSAGYELTAAGHAVTDTAERIERLMNELLGAVGDADRTASGTVRVTVPAWFAQYLIIPALPALRKTHPALDVHLITTDDVLNLARREADIGVRNARPVQQSLVARKGGVLGFAMYASRDYLVSHGAPEDRADFEGHQLVAYRNAVAHVAGYRWANELPCPVAFRATDAASMLDAVAAGLGIGVLPCFLADRDDRGVVRLESVGGAQPEVIWLVSHPDTRKIARVRVVTAWLVELFEKNAASLAGT